MLSTMLADFDTALFAQFRRLFPLGLGMKVLNTPVIVTAVKPILSVHDSSILLGVAAKFAGRERLGWQVLRNDEAAILCAAMEQEQGWQGGVA